MSADGLTLVCVPNVSEGRDRAVIARIAQAFAPPGGPVGLLDIHSDVDHHRSVFTLAGPPRALAGNLLEGARTIVEQVDLRRERGLHPHVGALDVFPVVYLDAASRGAACAAALVVADEISRELQIPVFLYGQLAGGRTRAELRRGGREGLAKRMSDGDCLPDFGPHRLHPSAGATLVAAREPLVAFNLELAPPATVADARRIAGLIREGGSHGLGGLRAIGVGLATGQARAELIPQVSMNVERPLELPLARVVQAVRAHAPVARAELVGLAPRAALAGFPEDLPMPGFDPARHVIENALGL